MIGDHTKANDELRALAEKQGVKLSAPDAALEARRRALRREYMSQMVSEHKRDVAGYEHEARDAKDPEVKQFAQKTLPVLREHLQSGS